MSAKLHWGVLLGGHYSLKHKGKTLQCLDSPCQLSLIPATATCDVTSLNSHNTPEYVIAAFDVRGVRRLCCHAYQAAWLCTLFL